MWKLKIFGRAGRSGWRLLEERNYKSKDLCRKRLKQLRNELFMCGYRTAGYYGQVG